MRAAMRAGLLGTLTCTVPCTIWALYPALELTRSGGAGMRDKAAEGGRSVSGPCHSFSPPGVCEQPSHSPPRTQVCASGLKAVMLAEQSIRTGGTKGEMGRIGGSGLRGVREEHGKGSKGPRVVTATVCPAFELSHQSVAPECGTRVWEFKCYYPHFESSCLSCTSSPQDRTKLLWQGGWSP